MKTNKVLFVFICLALFSCDLFNASLDPDYWEKIDAEIAWANAARLTVTVAVPQEWGTSPQNGTDRSFDAVRTAETPRLGYAFNVEFAPSSGYGFVEWLAFKSDEYPTNIATMDFDTAKDLSLKEEDAVITPGAQTHTGAFTAAVTVNIEDDITLIPFCDQRPRVIQSNPPLIFTGEFLPQNQVITILFNMPLDKDSVIFKPEHIEISAQWTGSNENSGNYADILNHFDPPQLDAGGVNIIINPSGNNLPPQNLLVTVTVGTGITSKEQGMASPVSFTYRIGAQTLKEVYNADHVWAIHDPLDSPYVLFSQVAPTNRDRRLRKHIDSEDPIDIVDTEDNEDSENPEDTEDPQEPENSETIKYAVTLYFTVTRSIGSNILDPNPEYVKIAEIDYANLQGGERNVLRGKRDVEFERVPLAISAEGADSEYRTENSLLSDNVWKTVYTWDTPPENGIIRLVILPGSDDFPEDTWENAVAEGRFVTVVMDDLPPGGSAGIALSGEVRVDIGVYNYNNTAANRTLIINADFSGIADNEGMGILPMAATRNNPWTRDDQSNIQWQYRIHSDATTYHESIWLPLSLHEQTVDLTNTNGTVLPSSTDIRNLQVRYRDNLGDESQRNVSEWVTMRQIRYYSPTINSVTTWSATYYETQSDTNVPNTIRVTWTRPTGMTGVEFSANDGTTYRSTSVSGSHIFTDVPRINDTGVRSGQLVSNVTGYTVTLTAYNDYGRQQTPTTVKIWNIPGMVVNQGNPAIEVTSVTGDNDDTDGTISLANLALGNANKQYVLAQDLSVTTTWTPRGTYTSAAVNNPFQSKFYGNGHTITINSFSTVSTITNLGLFGYVQDAEIRDLNISLSSNVNRSGELNFGGLAGRIGGSAVIRNVIVGGNNSTVNLTNSATSSSPTRAGILAGYMEPTARIENSYAGLELKVTTSGQSGIRAGGIAGFIDAGGTSLGVMIDRVTVAGTVEANSTHTTSTANLIYIGGIVGDSGGLGKIQDSNVTGTVRMTANSTSNNGSLDYIAGGITGRMRDGHILNCHFTGTINIPSTFNVIRQAHIGGLVGVIGQINETNATTGNPNPNILADVTVKDSSASGDINITSNHSTNTAGFKILLGGIVGAARGASDTAPTFVNFENCEYYDGSISLNMTGEGNIGGFAGDVISYVEFKNCQSRAELINATLSGGFNVGGFAGVFRGNASECYSTSSININNFSNGTGGNMEIGGFAGVFATGNRAPPEVPGYWLIDRCYASGSVTVESSRTTQNMNIFTGGFVGRINGTYNVEDCYATGNVSVIRSNSTSTGNTDTGGFVGRMNNTAGRELNRCFSTGSVTARSNVAAVSGSAFHAGGLVGFRQNGTINNSAALGSSVTMQGGGTDTTYRGYGSISGNAAGTNTHSNNYALDTLLLRNTNTYNGALSNVSPSVGLTGKDGGSAVITYTLSSTWWQRTMFFNSTNTAWDFSTPATHRGYPVLNGLDGQ